MSSVPSNNNEYPRIFEYAEALQHPSRCFRDPELQASKTDNDARGDPLPRVGGNAAVFKLMNGAKSVAVKVFKHGHDERERRYQIVNDYLATLRSPHLVGFRYQQEGIRVGRRWYPILIMDWVEGLRLTDQVGTWIRQSNKRALQQLANHWDGLIRHLKSNRIAHGDLQHGNILVVKQDLVLVDYDGMCVPALEGEQAWESGLPGYQHPRRGEQRLSLQVDDFSAWIIWIALRALVADPSLWKRHVEETDNENLLFTDNDVARPHQSKLWAELLRSSDREMAQRAGKLRDSIFKAFHEVPVFSLDAWSELRDLCARAANNHEQIARLANEAEQRGIALPADLVSQVNESRRRVASRRKLESALATRDPTTIWQAYEPDLVDDWLDRQTLSEAQKARPRKEAIEALRSALARDDGNTVVELWNQHRTVLDGVPVAEEIGKRADRWQRRLAARDRVLALLSSQANERDLVEAFKALQEVGGHPDVPTDLPQLKQARERLLWADVMRLLMRHTGEQADRGFQQKWRADLIGDGSGMDDLHQHLQGVEDRLRKLEALQKVLQNRLPGERIASHLERVIRAADQLPRDYAHAQQGEVKQARDWISLRDQLAVACRNSAWDEVVALAGMSTFARLGMPPELADHVEKANKRMQALKAFQAALQTNALLKVAPAWVPELLEGWPRYNTLVARGREARELVDKLPVLEQAAASPADGRLLQLWDSRPSWPIGWVEIDRIRGVVEEWRPRIEARSAFRALLHEPGATARSIADAWDNLQTVGSPPEAAPFADKADQARRRADCLEELQLVPGEASEETDRLFLATWQEALLAGWWEAEPQRLRLQAVRDRLALLAEMDEALRAADPGRALEAVARLTPHYRWRPRIEAWHSLRPLVHDPRATARSIADAWKCLRAVGCHPEAGPFADKADQARRRADCLDALEFVPVEASEEADRLFLATWREALLADWWEADPYRFRLQAVKSRLALLAEMDEALRAAESDRALEIAGRLPSAYRQNADRVTRLAAARDLSQQHDVGGGTLSGPRPKDGEKQGSTRRGPDKDREDADNRPLTKQAPPSVPARKEAPTRDEKNQPREPKQKKKSSGVGRIVVLVLGFLLAGLGIVLFFGWPWIGEIIKQKLR